LSTNEYEDENSFPFWDREGVFPPLLDATSSKVSFHPLSFKVWIFYI
jgi:hypothetical protein